MEEWQRLLVEGANHVGKLKELFPEIDERQLAAVARQFPMRINAYYLGLIRGPNDPFARQVIPDIAEILDPEAPEDPLAEEDDSPTPGITHRYPDRVLFYVNYQCPIYCRYCTRKRKIGDPSSVTPKRIEDGIEYIRRTPTVRDVVLSGGDPLLLKDDALVDLVRRLREVPHVEILRIGTRVPSALPQRVTPELCRALQPYHPIYVMTHFSHPRELTAEAKRACDLLADHGFPMMNQSVLLAGVNDNPETMKALFQGLLRFRVKPYYLYQADLAQGAAHFRTSLAKGLEVLEALRGHTSGLAVPYYVIDTPGGGGKVPILPEYVLKVTDEEVVVRNYEGKIFRYPLPKPDEAAEPVPAVLPAQARRMKRGA